MLLVRFQIFSNISLSWFFFATYYVYQSSFYVPFDQISKSLSLRIICTTKKRFKAEGSRYSAETKELGCLVHTCCWHEGMHNKLIACLDFFFFLLFSVLLRFLLILSKSPNFSDNPETNNRFTFPINFLSIFGLIDRNIDQISCHVSRMSGKFWLKTFEV